MNLKLLTLLFGIFLATGTAYAGPVPGGADTDGDTVEDAFDNCTTTMNADQADTNALNRRAHDGCGDACTPDMRCDISPPPNGNNGSINIQDRALLNMNFGLTGAPGIIGDCSPIDGSVNIQDRARLNMNFGATLPAGAGPSGITTAQCDPTTCTCTPAP